MNILITRVALILLSFALSSVSFGENSGSFETFNDLFATMQDSFEAIQESFEQQFDSLTEELTSDYNIFVEVDDEGVTIEQDYIDGSVISDSFDAEVFYDEVNNDQELVITFGDFIIRMYHYGDILFLVTALEKSCSVAPKETDSEDGTTINTEECGEDNCVMPTTCTASQRVMQIVIPADLDFERTIVTFSKETGRLIIQVPYRTIPSKKIPVIIE